jgi:RNA-binding protein
MMLHKLELKIIKVTTMELFREIAENKAKVTIGKNLLSDKIIEQILNLIKKKEILKIKLTKSVGEQKEHIITEILHKTKTNLLDIRGNSFILSKKNIKGLNLKISLKCKELTNRAQNL